MDRVPEPAQNDWYADSGNAALCRTSRAGRGDRGGPVRAAGGTSRSGPAKGGGTSSVPSRSRQQDSGLCQYSTEDGKMQDTIERQADQESRLERGKRVLSEIDGEAGEKVIDSLADIAPDFARYVLEFPFGDIYSRPGLDIRAREIATIAALTALGNATPQLKVHIAAGLNVGISRDEIVETIMQMAVYAGFPAALNGLFAAKEVFRDHV